MYYTLLELRVLPKTEGAYHALSDHTARWRESNVLPRDCFADNTRDTIQDFDDYFESIDDYLGRGIYHLQYAKDNYSIPRWHNQSNYVEVWLRKMQPLEHLGL